MSPNNKADICLTGAAEIVTGAIDQPGRVVHIKNGSLAIQGETILSVGTRSQVAAEADLSQARVIDVSGKIVAPGFVDCHTHLVFGRSRSREFALKMTLSAAEIATMGIETGIPASIRMTRDATEDELFAAAMDRMARMLRHGTTTVESKSDGP